MLDAQENKVIKAILACKGGKESQEDLDLPDCTEGSLEEMGSPEPLACQVPQAHLD